MSMSGQIFDAASEPPIGSPAPQAGVPRQAAAGQARQRYIGVRFVCCEVYTRVYLNREGTAYRGNCPRCGKRLEIKIGPGGTDQRFFEAC